MMCFHLLRPYKAPEKHPPCCFNVWARARVRACQSFCFPACTDMGHLLKKSVWLMTGTTPKTKIPKNKTREVYEENAATVTKHSTFPETRAGFEPFSLKLLYEWIQAQSISLILTEMKFPILSFIDPMNGRDLEVKMPRSTTWPFMPAAVAEGLGAGQTFNGRSWRRLRKLNMGFIRGNKHHSNVRLERSLLLVQQALL